MVAAIIFAQVWGVVQLLILTSAARTVRARTVCGAMAVGFYAMGPLTAFIQLSWVHVAASLFHMNPLVLKDLAGYTFDPFLEEGMKLLPLLVLMGLPSIRRQWSLSDCVLVAAATGSGFGLTEQMFRYAAYPHMAQAVAGGWIIPVGLLNQVFVPGFFHTLTSWVTCGAFNTADPININWHLAWSAIGGLAVGLFVRTPVRRSRLIASGLFVLIGLNHAGGNITDIHHSWLSLLAGPLHLMSLSLGVLVFAAVAVAWWLDQPVQRAGLALGPLLASETTPAAHPAVATLRAALSRLPWSIAWVYGFDRERRAFHAAHATAGEGCESMRAALLARRDLVERQLVAPEIPPLIPASIRPEQLLGRLRASLRRPPFIVWLVLIAPSVLFLILGGFPQTAWLQHLLTSAFLWPVFVLITIVNQGRNAWRVFKGVRTLPATARLPIGDDAAVLGLQLACGLGAAILGGFTLERVLSGVGATQLLTAHASDAIGRATASSAAASANSVVSPPPSTPSSNGTPGNASSDGTAASPAAGGSSADSAGGVPEPGAPDVAAAGGVTPAQPTLPDAAAAGGQPPSMPQQPTLPDASAAGGQPPAVPTQSNVDSETDPDASKAEPPDDQPPTTPQPPPHVPTPMTPQQQADAAAAAAAKADADAQAADAARVQADRDADSASIRQATAPPDLDSDPDVAAARDRTKAAHDALDNPGKAADPGDPWKDTSNTDAQAKQEATDAEQAQRALEQSDEAKFQNQLDADNAAAQQAAKDAEAASEAAYAKAAAAHQAAANAQEAADQAAAKSSDPQEAAAGAAGLLNAAEAREKNAFYHGTLDQHHDASVALDAARAKAQAAQAAAEAAQQQNSGGSIPPPHKKS